MNYSLAKQIAFFCNKTKLLSYYYYNQYNLIMTAEELLKNIDWSELRNQKTTLLNVITMDEVSPEQTQDLEGIIVLIDSLQDHAVDELNIDSIHVFDFDQEDPDDVSNYLDNECDDKRLKDVNWEKDEKVLLMLIINTFGNGQHPSCDEQTLDFFTIDYVKELVNDERLTPNGNIILDQIKNKLNKL